MPQRYCTYVVHVVLVSAAISWHLENRSLRHALAVLGAKFTHNGKG